MATEPWLEELLHTARHGDVDGRVSALRALGVDDNEVHDGELTDADREEVFDVLRGAATDEVSAIRLAAVGALVGLRRKEPEVIPLYVAALTRHDAAEQAPRWKTEQAALREQMRLEELVALLGTIRPVRDDVVEAMASALVADPSPELRLRIVAIFDRWKRHDGVGLALERVIDDPDPRIAEAVARALDARRGGGLP